MYEQTKEIIKQMPETLNDELPTPPEDITQELSGIFDESLLDDVPDVNEAIPKGTFHFRVDQYFINWNEPTDRQGNQLWPEKQPDLGILWKCQEEPHTGRSFIKNVPWVTPDVFEKASQGDPAARELIRVRLPQAKAMLKGCEFRLGGKDFFKDFLDEHPEARLTISVKEKKRREGSEFVGTGEMKNDIVKYIPLSVPFSR